MTTETFGYNKQSAIQTMLICAGFMAVLVFFLTEGTYSVSDFSTWLDVTILAALISYVVYLFVKRLMPALRQEVVMELTPAGLIFNPKHIIIPWKNISDIDTRASGRTAQHLEISLIEPAGEHISIELHWIAGDPVDVYNAVSNYLYETRKAPERSAAG